MTTGRARARSRARATDGIMGGIFQPAPLDYRAPILHGGHH